MPFLDDERLRYPIEYINLAGGRISNLKQVPNKPDLLMFTFTSHLGFSVFCQTRTELVTNIKEGMIQSGTVEGILKFTVPEDRNMTNTRVFMSIEEWDNVIIA